MIDRDGFCEGPMRVQVLPAPDLLHAYPATAFEANGLRGDQEKPLAEDLAAGQEELPFNG